MKRATQDPGSTNRNPGHPLLRVTAVFVEYTRGRWGLEVRL
jgi:hypothetical protein